MASFGTIVAATGAPADHVRLILDHMRRWGTYKSKCDRKKVGKEYHFRLSPADNQISVHELIELAIRADFGDGRPRRLIPSASILSATNDPLDQLEKRQQMSDLSSKPRVTPPNTHSPNRVCP